MRLYTRASFDELVEKLASLFDVDLEWYEMSQKSKDQLNKMQRDAFSKPGPEEEDD